jgi:lipoprotein-anchoring transpeptidase ErfK/SrfK
MLKTIVRLCLLLLLAPLALTAQPQARPQAQPQAGGGPSPKAGGDVQILLNRAGFSPGVIDGKPGSNTWKALQAFQAAHDLPATGKMDEVTWENLIATGGNQMVVEYTITPEDVDGPFVPKMPEDMLEKSKLEALAYTSLLEMLAERFHTTPGFLQTLNPGARFAAGETIRVPNARHVSTEPQAGLEDVRVVVSRSQGTLTVERGDDVLFFAPVTSGSEHDPLPIGDWKVLSVSRNPVFNYNPDLFWDADPAHSKAKIAPGPNNPVGLVWIDLSKEHYGLHGTPEPQTVGKTSSHGCVRLTNWDALTVAGLVQKGTPVLFRP